MSLGNIKEYVVDLSKIMKNLYDSRQLIDEKQTSTGLQLHRPPEYILVVGSPFFKFLKTLNQ
jgi:hypothetical protein